MLPELVARAFADRDMAHVEHFKTRSYAAHMALNEFYDGVVSSVDALVEAYIGCFGNLEDVPQADRAPYSIDALQETADWIEVNRDEIANESDAVANLVDGVTAVYLKAIYKLTHFK